MQYNDHMVDVAKQSGPTREALEIEDLSTLELLVHPLRMRVLNAVLKSARTVKEISEELELPVTRLYYHVNMLTKAGIIEVAATEKSGPMTQRRFRAVAAQYAPSKSLTHAIENDRRMAEFTTALVLETARVDAEALLTNARIDPNRREAKGVLGRTFLTIDPDRVQYWTSRMAEVIDEIEKEGEFIDNGELYGFTFVLAPLAAPLRAGAE